MSHLVLKERPASGVMQDAYERFHREIQAAATGEPINVEPAGNVDDQLLRVLIVDDQKAMADTMSALVGIWGHEVRHAYDGVTGLALAAAFRPDVLLLDILMPNVSGVEVAIQMRRQNRLKDCFIVAVTGRTDAIHRSRCYEAGVDLVLIKPVVPPHLQTLLMLESQRVRSRKDENLKHMVLLNQ
jgi:two-component system, OmpR family, alkaline phosphatase synthesis response regulator PhoP